ncbi:hypothetical protein BIW11_13242 [Tropilaelaps mercedesae]|uniref:Uncharacterized protein n=1 Tax=Tropilaelaps mercedesae TaxID=418985 RepID=A0A1V9X3D3_9ACAR|nr:hypothetical protein BIW11_13242 [Tropilaelaps mercedesae]
MEASRLVREKVDAQSARLLELEQVMAQKDSQGSLVQELQQRIGELEREREIVEDSNRKLVQQSEELKQHMAAQERIRLHQPGHTEGEGAAAKLDSDPPDLSDENLAGSALLHDMLLQLRDKFENLERHIDDVVDEARRRRSKPSRVPRESSNEPRTNGSTTFDRERRKSRPAGASKERGDRIRPAKDSQDARRSTRNSAEATELNGIYAKGGSRTSVKSGADQPDDEHVQEHRSASRTALSNGSSIPLPKPRRRLLIKAQHSQEGSTGSSGESPDTPDNGDESPLESPNRHNSDNDIPTERPHSQRPRTSLTQRREAVVKSEATQTSRSPEQHRYLAFPLQPPVSPPTSSRVKQTTKILSSDDSVSEMTELSLSESNAPHFEIHVDKVRLAAIEGVPLQALAKRNVIVSWELADFEVQSTPVGHLCRNNDELVFNCTARYILEEEGQLEGAGLHLQVATADGELLGECDLHVSQLQTVLQEPKKKLPHSANLDLDGQAAGTLELWLRYIPRPEKC